jgi:hypothetical protein
MMLSTNSLRLLKYVLSSVPGARNLTGQYQAIGGIRRERPRHPAARAYTGGPTAAMSPRKL